MSLHADFAALIGAGHVKDRAALAELDPGFHPDNLAADLAVYPADTAELAEIVRLCAQHRTPIVPQGGRTGLSGGAASGPGSIVLGMRRMAAIEALDPLAGTVRVQCGATLQAVEEAARAHGLSVGIDLGARGTATIGGMISTNAGGMEAFRNGSMRNHVLGVEVVLANGSVLNDLTEVPKCNEGYDLKHLFCGAEGTLGIVTRAVLKLSPAPQSDATLLIACQDAASALRIVRACRADRMVEVLQAEIMWRAYARTVATEIGLADILSFCDAPAYLLLELAARGDDTETAIHSIFARDDVNDAMRDALIAKNERERRDIWRIREESFIVDNVIPNCEWFDISVPLGRIDATVAAIKARLHALDPHIGIWVMGHLGDGNLHYTISAGSDTSPARRAVIADAVYSGLKEIGGAFSAEHGIGIDKRTSLARYSDPAKLRLMHQIKAIFDPQGIMNPGKLF